MCVQMPIHALAVTLNKEIGRQGEKEKQKKEINPRHIKFIFINCSTKQSYTNQRKLK